MITRDDIRQYLGDRQWHTGVELIEHFSRLIPPEQASQTYYATRKKAARAEVPVDAAVRKGGELGRFEPPFQPGRCGLVETRGGKNFIEKQVRWTAWYCWLCGYQVKASTRWPRAACAGVRGCRQEREGVSPCIFRF